MSSKHLNMNMSQPPLLILSSGSVAPCLSQYKGSITPLVAQTQTSEQSWTSYSYTQCASYQQTMSAQHLKYTYCPLSSLHVLWQHPGSSHHICFQDYHYSLFISLSAWTLSLTVKFSLVARDTLTKQTLEMSDGFYCYLKPFIVSFFKANFY